LKHRDSVPVKEVLPALLDTGVLPLKEDYQENEPVWKMIISLYQAQDATVMGLTGRLAPIMMSVLGEPEDQLTEEMRGEPQALVEHLKATHR
jgi:importin-4